MPTFRKSKDAEHYFALTSISGRVITFQLSQSGRERLLAAGFRDGDKFERDMLFDLYRSGDAFTYGTGTSVALEQDRQLQLDFAEETTPDRIFPACSGCGSVDDLHLALGRGTSPYDSLLFVREMPKT